MSNRQSGSPAWKRSFEACGTWCCTGAHDEGDQLDRCLPAAMTLGAGDLVLCSGTLPRGTPWTERLEAASRAGFTGLSVWARDYAAARSEGWTDADMRAQLNDHGLAVAEID